MKIFLATSFSSQIGANGGIIPSYKKFVEDIINALRAKGHEVFCAAEYEGWRYFHATAKVGVRKDLEEIDKSDAVVALLHEKISGGIHTEIGYAVGLGKKVILATQNLELRYFNQGMVDNNRAQSIQFKDPAELADKATEFLKE